MLFEFIFLIVSVHTLSTTTSERMRTWSITEDSKIVLHNIFMLDVTHYESDYTNVKGKSHYTSAHNIHHNNRNKNVSISNYHNQP